MEDHPRPHVGSGISLVESHGPGINIGFTPENGDGSNPTSQSTRLRPEDRKPPSNPDHLGHFELCSHRSATRAAIQHFTDLAQKRARMKWFLKEIGSRIDLAVVHDEI